MILSHSIMIVTIKFVFAKKKAKGGGKCCKNLHIFFSYRVVLNVYMIVFCSKGKKSSLWNLDSKLKSFFLFQAFPYYKITASERFGQIFEAASKFVRYEILFCCGYRKNNDKPLFF